MAPHLAAPGMSAGPSIRAESPDDRPAVTALVTAAFGRQTEAELVERLREAGALAISLVAVADDDVVGHIAFSPISIGGVQAGQRWLGLAPLAVLPGRQRQGIGAALMDAGLDAAERAGADLVVVLGEPAHYGRFGFVPASRYGLALPWPVPEEAFMARLAGTERPPAGMVRYHPAFDAAV